MALFSNSSISQLQRALDMTSMSQNLTSQNIANADTPNYKAKHLVFSNLLKNSMSNQKGSSISNNLAARVVEDQSTSMQNNGNNVDLDKEMTDLAKNQLQYQTLVELLNSQFSDIKTVIRG